MPTECKDVPVECPAHKMEVAYAERLSRIETQIGNLTKEMQRNRSEKWLLALGSSVTTGLMVFIVQKAFM